MATTATAQASEIFERLDHLHEALADQALVSQNRWVDHLLDLFNMIDSAPVRRVVEDTLSAMRNLRAVETSWMAAQLELLAAAVEVESAFDHLAVAVH